MGETGIQLPPTWTSVRELTEYVWDLSNCPMDHIIDLTKELSRNDFQNQMGWYGVDTIKLITITPPWAMFSTSFSIALWGHTAPPPPLCLEKERS